MNTQQRLLESAKSLARSVPAPARSVTALLRDLYPRDSGHDLVRIGPAGDGGYLVPDADLSSIGMVFSAGVGPTWGFEDAMADTFGVPSVLCDGSIDRPVGMRAAHLFDRTWISGAPAPYSMTLDQWVATRANSLTGDLMLQMDIEGAEWAALEAVSDETLRRFRVVVLELHGLSRIGRLYDRGRQSGILRRLLRHFHVVHLHPNNYQPPIHLAGIAVPDLLEVTLLRSDWMRGNGHLMPLPHPLDCINVPSKPPVEIDPRWRALCEPTR